MKSQSLVEILPRYITAIYNSCLRSGTFPTRWKKAKTLPITKPGKESSDEVSKFRPISLLDIGGKVLEKVLINRINHHMFSQGFMNKNQYGFTPQKGTIDVAMADFRFSEHISYATERCTKLIHSLSKSAKVLWGLKHEVLKTIFKRAILPLLLYGAPVWLEAMKYEYNRLKYIRVQRLTNIRMAKAFCTTSSEALCILTGMTPIIIKTEEAVKQYNIRKGKGSQTHLFDSKVELKNWRHPADAVKIIKLKNIRNKQSRYTPTGA